MKKYFALIIGIILAASLCFAVSAGDKTVVYLSSTGAGDGSSAASPVATIEEAYNALDLSKDCTIVLCGPFFQFQNFSYGKDFTGSVTMTSVYDGVDYRETAGAVYQFESITNTCFGDTRFENMNFESLTSGILFACQHNPFTVGTGVNMSGSLTGGTIAKSFAIFGGYVDGQGELENTKDVNITVLSGAKFYIVPFSRNMKGDTVAYTGTANIKIGGDAQVSVMHGSSTGTVGIQLGTVKIEQLGNSSITNFYGATGDVNVTAVDYTWKSGVIKNFYWNCPSTSAADYKVSGSRTLNVTPTAKASENFEAIAANFDAINSIADDPNNIVTTAPAETTAAPVETTAAPVVTTAAPVVTTAAPVVTTAAPVETTKAPETTAAPVETTVAPVETTAAPVETTQAPATTTSAPTPAAEEGSNVGVIVGVIVAVVVVAAIVVVVVKKKKQ